tara:strand:+ start:2427 stop:2639 length:213 start_codon:yes stop_codon:yes gene_type:complete
MTVELEVLIVQYDSDYRFNLLWADKDGENQEYICAVIGLANAVSAAEAIAHEQAKCVMYDFNQRSSASVH